MKNKPDNLEEALKLIRELKEIISHLVVCLEYSELEISDWEEQHGSKMPKRGGDPR